MKRASSAFALLIVARTMAAQDLPPGVLLLSRVKTHISEELRRLGTISCLETVQREHQAAHGQMRPLDTVRLEVITNGEKELFASPGARKFSENHPMSYAGSGAMGTGVFGPYLKEILLNDSVSSRYQGEEEAGGHQLVRYDYRISSLISGQFINTAEGSGKVGLHGSYWVNPQTLDVTRLEMNADDFPPSLPVTEMTTSINYARTRLDSGLLLLLPQSADLRLAKYSGEISHNRMDFTHCREFGAESSINFDDADSPEQTPHFGDSSVDDTFRPLPPGLQISVKLRSRVSGDMAVGTLIDGVIASNVLAKRAVVIPAGSLVRGRIRRMEKYTNPFPYFVVGLEFTEVEVQGIRFMFYADSVGIDQSGGVELILSTKNTTTQQSDPLAFGSQIARQTTETLFLYNLPGVALFFDKGSKLELPAGFLTVWKTRPYKPGA